MGRYKLNIREDATLSEVIDVLNFIGFTVPEEMLNNATFSSPSTWEHFDVHTEPPLNFKVVSPEEAPVELFRVEPEEENDIYGV